MERFASAEEMKAWGWGWEAARARSRWELEPYPPYGF